MVCITFEDYLKYMSMIKFKEETEEYKIEKYSKNKIYNEKRTKELSQRHDKMFKDVYYLWKNNQQEITPEKLYKICDEYKIIPYVFYILYYTNQIYNDFELDKFVEAFKCSEGVFLLDYYGLNDWERKFWRVDFKKRLITDNLWELIKEDLTENDIKKLERNRRIFG